MFLRLNSVLFLTLLALMSQAGIVHGAGEPPAPPSVPPVDSLPVEQFNVVVEKLNAYTAGVNAAQEVHRAYDANAPAKRAATAISAEDIAKVKSAAALAPKSPALPAADAAIGELAAAIESAPPAFARFFAAETALGAAVAPLRPLVERRQMAVGEQARGRDLGWHVRAVLAAVKPLVELIPTKAPPPNKPPMDPKVYATRLADLETASTALDAYADAHPSEVAALPEGAALRADLAALLAAAKGLRPALEAKKLDQAAIGKRINDLINRYNSAVKRVNAAPLSPG